MRVQAVAADESGLDPAEALPSGGIPLRLFQVSGDGVNGAFLMGEEGADVWNRRA